MRLLYKTGIWYLLFSAILLSGAGAFLYFHQKSIIDEEVDEKLVVDTKRVINLIENGKQPIEIPPMLEVEQLTGQIASRIELNHIEKYDPIEEENEFFREAINYCNINGQPFKITVRRVVLEPHDYLDTIGTSFGFTFGGLLIGLSILTLLVSRGIWKSFYHNIEVIKGFSIDHIDPIQLRKSGIKEFKQLNHALLSLTSKIQSDYRSIKDFTENASHEIQTPLAIIQTKLEDALQADSLTEQQAICINAALKATKRLSVLNQHLLLLTKIDNQQFTQKESAKLDDKIQESLNLFNEFIDAKNIKVEVSLEAKTVNCNAFLLDTLLSNIVGNSIKHNIQDGFLNITLQGETLSVSNSGEPFEGNPEEFFQRFNKSDPSSNSLGLGLSIVKRICELNNWEISYTLEGNSHSLEIKFNRQ